MIMTNTFPCFVCMYGMYTAGFYNCPALVADLPGLLTEARARGATCSLGPQWDASEEWGGLDELYPLLDVFMPNEVKCADKAEIRYIKGANKVQMRCTQGGSMVQIRCKYEYGINE